MHQREKSSLMSILTRYVASHLLIINLSPYHLWISNFDECKMIREDKLYGIQESGQKYATTSQFWPRNCDTREKLYCTNPRQNMQQHHNPDLKMLTWEKLNGTYPRQKYARASQFWPKTQVFSKFRISSILPRTKVSKCATRVNLILNMTTTKFPGYQTKLSF